MGVEAGNDNGKQCFLDLKFHDIPHTVAKSVESAAALQVLMLTLHTSGGAEMLRAAAAVGPRPRLLGVTVLTSVAGDVEVDKLDHAHEDGPDGDSHAHDHDHGHGHHHHHTGTHSHDV